MRLEIRTFSSLKSLFLRRDPSNKIVIVGHLTIKTSLIKSEDSDKRRCMLVLTNSQRWDQREIWLKERNSIRQIYAITKAIDEYDRRTKW